MGFLKYNAMARMAGIQEAIPRQTRAPGAAQGAIPTRTRAQAAAHEALPEQSRAVNIAATGIDGTASVVAARETSAQVNFNPIVELDLAVIVDGRAPYPVRVRQIVSQLYLPKVQPGSNLVVKVDPGDPSAVWVDLVGS